MHNAYRNSQVISDPFPTHFPFHFVVVVVVCSNAYISASRRDIDIFVVRSFHPLIDWHFAANCCEVLAMINDRPELVMEINRAALVCLGNHQNWPGINGSGETPAENIG